MISKETIDKIYSTIRVEEVISDFVNLKKSGTNYKGLSPFVDEKSPSFMVSPSKQIWKDFSSGKGGNTVAFIMEHEQYTYPEALRYLAKKYSIEIEEEETVSEEQKEFYKSQESLYQLSEVASEYFQNQLWEEEEGGLIGLSYFRERGFRDDIIKKFQLGYSPKKKDAFTKFAQSKTYKKEVLQNSGLSIFREGSDDGVDRFRERVIFPIHSFSGRVLGFGGRILKTNAKTAKYLNSPESEIYHKSKILYGIFHAKQSIIKEENCYLVEGYTDVVSFNQAGVENVVASSGTALTNDQIRLVKRLTNNITILFDGDSAGIKASFRGIDMILSQGMNVRVLLFPENEDPDSFARNHSPEELREYLKSNVTDFIKFKTNLLLEDTAGDPIKKAALVGDIVSSIALVDNIIQQEIYVKETSVILDISEEVLFRELAQRAKSAGKEERRAPIEMKPVQKEQKEKISQIKDREFKLIELLLKYGNHEVELSYMEGQEPYTTTITEEIVGSLDDDNMDFETVFYKEILDEIKEGLESEEIRVGEHFMKKPSMELSQILADMLLDSYEISENWSKQDIHVPTVEENLSKNVKENILSYKSLKIKEMINIEKQELDGDIDEKKRIEIYEKIQNYSSLLRDIKLMLNRLI